MKITIEFDKNDNIKLTAAFLKEAAQRVTAEQLRQVNQAFVSGGQPGLKWPPIKPMVGTAKTKGGREKSYESYRNGGQPLRNTGALKQSFETNVVKNSSMDIDCVVSSPLAYAAYQQYGFTTAGPNFIPLNRKAARSHVKGANPKLEGLVQGKDYIMAWNGVTVPARPIVDYADATNQRKLKLAVQGET